MQVHEEIDLHSVERRVAGESRRFRDALPRLLSRLRGRWVIFLDGAVQGDFADCDAAYREAVRRFGLYGGFVIAEVTEPADADPVQVTDIFLASV